MGGRCFSVRWNLSCSKYHTELVKYFAFVNNLNILSLCLDRLIFSDESLLFPQEL